MDERLEFDERVEELVERDPRYRGGAYAFVMLALQHTVNSLAEPRHVSGQELLQGIREYALREYGPMAKTVFEHWGVHGTVDFGHLVFNLVGVGLLGRTDNDRIEDFMDGYDFEEVFVREYPWTAALGAPD